MPYLAIKPLRSRSQKGKSLSAPGFVTGLFYAYFGLSSFRASSASNFLKLGVLEPEGDDGLLGGLLLLG